MEATSANSETVIPRDIVAVWMDETRFYNLAAEDAPFIERIIGVYILDRSERTYCCEVTPSYLLHHVYDVVTTYEETPDEVRERLWEEYALNGGDDIYVHCSVINALPPERIYYVWGDGANDDNDAMESAREHIQGNPPF